MKPKLCVTNQLKNHFQKGIIILVATLLLAIPNTRIHSFIGSYQTSSIALTANDGYEKSLLEEKNISALGLGLGLGLGAIIAVGFVALVVIGVISESTDSIFPESIPSKIVDQMGYKKYDFSKFDN